MTHHLVVSKNSLQTSPKTPPQKPTHSKKKSNNPFEDDFLNSLHPNLALLDFSPSPAANCPNQPTNQPPPWIVGRCRLSWCWSWSRSTFFHGKMWVRMIELNRSIRSTDGFFPPKKKQHWKSAPRWGGCFA